MAGNKTLDRFKSIVGKSESIADFTSKISPTGDFTKVTNLQALIESWKKILLIPTRSYIDDPDFGSDLYLFVFRLADQTTLGLIESEIRNRILRFDDRAELDSIDIRYLSNRKGFVVNAVVEFDGEKGQLDLVFDESLLK